MLIDIDNPDYKPEVNPIISHSRLAKVYQFRPPYLDDFFKISSEKMCLNQESSLLDLCCGRGELASRFSPFVKSIVAIDGSEEMLNNRIQCENIKYIKRDINLNGISVNSQFNFVVIGSAIHLIKREHIRSLIENSIMEEGGILITHTLFKYDPSYVERLHHVNSIFGRTLSNFVDLQGKNKMEDLGYELVDKIRIEKEVNFGIEYLINNQLSYAYHEFYNRLVKDIEEYKRSLKLALAPYSVKGKLSARLINWGLIYKKSKADMD